MSALYSRNGCSLRVIKWGNCRCLFFFFFYSVPSLFKHFFPENLLWCFFGGAEREGCGWRNATLLPSPMLFPDGRPQLGPTWVVAVQRSYSFPSTLSGIYIFTFFRAELIQTFPPVDDHILWLRWGREGEAISGPTIKGSSGIQIMLECKWNHASCVQLCVVFFFFFRVYFSVRGSFSWRECGQIPSQQHDRQRGLRSKSTAASHFSNMRDAFHLSHIIRNIPWSRPILHVNHI
jgi:hypothetical protein